MSMNRLTVAGRAVLVAAMCVLVASLVEAQTMGRVEGNIVDAGGLPVAGATVKARHVATETVYTVESNGLGRYTFAALPPGTYEVTASAPSFEAAILTVHVALASATTANFDPSTPKTRSRPVRRGLGAINFEASGRLGWTFSDGVSGDKVLAVDGNLYDRIEPVDSVSWGFTLGGFLTRRIEIEFLFDRQLSTLQVGGTNTVDVADLNIGNYHGVFSYNFGSESTPVRPYLFGGAGATTYGRLSFVGGDGQPREVGGSARMSPTFGVGVKIYRGPVGLRLEARMTPTYIKSNAAGWWCDPYWGCYVVQDAQYSSQFQLSSGVTFRF
jgi:hypothetical protein